MSCKLTVPDPCHEDWNKMTPADKGRYCSACNKVVVDFTPWELNDVAAYLRKHQAGSVCGRFRNQHLGVEIPYSTEEWVGHISQSRLTMLQRIALIFLLAFGILVSGCTTEGPQESKVQAEANLIEGMLVLPPVQMDTSAQIEATRSPKPYTSAKRKQTHKPADVIGVETIVEVTAGVPVFEPVEIARDTSSH